MFNACSLYNSYAGNFYFYKAYFNQSPYDEVIGKLGKEKFAFTIERLSLSDFSFRRSATTKNWACLQ